MIQQSLCGCMANYNYFYNKKKNSEFQFKGFDTQIEFRKFKRTDKKYSVFGIYVILQGEIKT